MSDFFKDSLPLMERLTTELGKLETVTKEIEKAKNAATQHAEAADRQKEAAGEAVRAAKLVVTAQDKLLDRIGQQHQQSMGEQELLLHEHAESLSQRTTEQIDRQLDGVRQSATKVQELIDALLTEQPTRLAAIEKQHQQGVNKQQEVLQNGVQRWADQLHERMQVELKLLRQATEVLQKNTRQQHDELSAVANQLQVVAGRVTAFAEVMNAAKFTARLESIEQSSGANATALGKLTDLYRQQGADFTAELQRGQQKTAEAAEQYRKATSQELTRIEGAHEQQTVALQTSLEQLTAQLAQSSKQQRLWQVVTIVVVAVGIAVFVLRN